MPQFKSAGGESGIRTHDTVSRIHAFQACAFSHSAISPINQFCAPRGPTVSTGYAALRAYQARKLPTDCSLILRSVLLNDGNLDFIVRIAGSQLGSLVFEVDQSKTSKCSETSFRSPEFLASRRRRALPSGTNLQGFGVCEFRRNFCRAANPTRQASSTRQCLSADLGHNFGD